MSKIVGTEGGKALYMVFHLAINMREGMKQYNVLVCLPSPARVGAGAVITSLTPVSSRSPHDTFESNGFLFPIYVQPWMVSHLPGATTFAHIKREHWLQETA